jgi:hypothetical protein
MKPFGGYLASHSVSFTMYFLNTARSSCRVAESDFCLTVHTILSSMLRHRMSGLWLLRGGVFAMYRRGYLPRLVQVLRFGLFAMLLSAESGLAQTALTWQEVPDKFHAANRTLQAGQIGVDESRASEVTAFLRPNPSLNVLNDQINPFNSGPPNSTFGALLSAASISYLHEREHKRELRLESAKDASSIRSCSGSGRIFVVISVQDKEIRGAWQTVRAEVSVGATGVEDYTRTV